MSSLNWHSNSLEACLQGEMVTLKSGLILAGGQKIARVHKQNFTGGVTLKLSRVVGFYSRLFG